MSGQRPKLLGAALTTAAMLAVLLGLGIWQVQRLYWKLGIIARLDAAEHQPPAPLGDAPAPYSIVSVTGHLRTDLASHFRNEARDFPAGQVIGTGLLVPLERPGALPVLVDLGWVPVKGPPPALPTAETVTITGYIRQAESVGWFAATDDAGTRHFYTLDPTVIGPQLGLPAMAPFTVIALGPPPTAADAPIPAEHLPRPPNDHLKYAIIWFSLAGVLLVIFSLHARSVLRR